ALRAMAQFHVRRLPVIGPDGLLEGILSLDDIVVAAVSTDAPTSSEILEAMRTILIKEAEEPEFEVDTVI
ncbi:MAG TPA: CBS domain-containing protein, partial [Vicinamibacterales bacterium]|nr:CBS domain-containing protein [Vicinamibacterales bacterium]